jgi:hypothetical protein
MDSLPPLERLSRRDVLKFFTAATAAFATTGLEGLARPGEAPGAVPKGYGTDPDLTKIHQPGDVWPLTFDDSQRNTAQAFADVLFPEDQYGPAASALRVHDYIDEWISAPYPQQLQDRPVILDGLEWLRLEAQERFAKNFPDLSLQQQHSICDDICWAPDAKKEFKKAAGFFSKFRAIAGGAYFSTPAGWKAIGYVGNTPMASFDGPPKEVLERLGLSQPLDA